MRPPLLALLLASSLPGADLIEANRDPAVSARQDFWTHANGTWLRRFPLAPDRAVYNSVLAKEAVAGQVQTVTKDYYLSLLTAKVA